MGDEPQSEKLISTSRLKIEWSKVQNTSDVV